MNRSKLSRMLPLILLVPVAVWGVHAAADTRDANPLTANGTYQVTFHVAAPSTVADGSTVTCKAMVSPKPSLFDHLKPEPVPVESVQGIAKVVGSSANCTVELPFAFVLADAQKGAALSYRIDAFTTSGPAFLRTQQGISVEFPHPGATTNLLLDVNL